MAEIPPSLGPEGYKFYLTAKVFDFLHRIAGVVLYLGLAYFSYLSVVELAGKVTIANFFLQYIADSKESRGWLWVVIRALPWVLAISCTAWAMLERYLRKKTVESMQGRIKQLELRLDPGRSTSTLTNQGDTNPRDASI